MHELAICESLVETVLDELHRLDSPGRLLRVRVAAGALRQIVPDSLLFAYGELSKGTPAEGSVLDLVEVPATCACHDCGSRGHVRGEVFRCPACGSMNVEISGGSELYVESLEVDVDE